MLLTPAYDTPALSRHVRPCGSVPRISSMRLIQKHHPDKNEDKERAKVVFTEITEAYTGRI